MDVVLKDAILLVQGRPKSLFFGALAPPGRHRETLAKAKVSRLRTGVLG